MARVNGPAAEVHARLVEAGIDLKAGQVANVLSARLATDDDPLEKWAALSAMRRGPSKRLPDGDQAALLLAVEDIWCEPLPDAVVRLGTPHRSEVDIRGGRLTLAEAQAEQLMSQSEHGGDEREQPYGQRLADHLLDGAAAGHQPVSEKSAEDIDHERLGLAQALATELAEALGGRPTTQVIDSEDAARVTGSTSHELHLLGRWFDQSFGPNWLDGFNAKVRAAESPTLVAAVHTAYVLLPLYEQAVVEARASRWQLVATLVPIMLALPDLLAIMGAETAPLVELLAAVASQARALATGETGS